jgi:serine/threonine-protein kinase
MNDGPTVCSAQGIRSPHVGHSQPAKFLGIGSKISGKYIVESYLGTGGMCEVYKAHHLELMSPVALKMLRPVFSKDSKSSDRFHREALALNKLDHENIVKMYGFGYFTSRFQSRPYMALEFVEGISLCEFLKRREGKTLPRDIAAPIFFKICDALAHAHSRGVIHRDLKPSNIMIGHGNVVKLIDFGIAKVTESEEVQRLTHAGETVGSIVYMSPEQCTGSDLDLRSDIYSLGCLMYEVMTGQPPLTGRTPYATMHKHLFQDPEVKPVLDNEFGSVIMRTLSKDPDCRPQSASDLKRALYDTHSKIRTLRQPDALKKSWRVISNHFFLQRS